MRNEEETLRLIVGGAARHDNIRAVYMNGSRTNPNSKKDIFQDYDIVYVVQENRPFYTDKKWIDVFGERLYMQCPEEVDVQSGIARDFDTCYGWLIQFADGNRLDLRVMPIEEADVLADKLCVVLLDKDGVLPSVAASSDVDYHIKRPTQDEFMACCNEFWWCLNNVAKGLWREEIPYVHTMLYETVHPQLVKLLNWQIGYETGFSLSTGKASKYMRDYLSEPMWERFLQTYSSGSVESMWDATYHMCDLFNEVAHTLEATWGHTYNQAEADASYGFLRHVRTLSKDAPEIF